MADSHLQVNHDGSLETKKTVLWATSESDKKDVLLSIFSQPNWDIDRLEHIEGSYWKLETHNQNISYKINLYVSSVRDEARKSDEYKMQLGAITPIVEEGWKTLIMGIYTISHGTTPNEYILSAYNKDRFTFSTNPSIRGTRTIGLQKAKILGFYKTDISYLFRPEFIYYYLQNQELLNNDVRDSDEVNEIFTGRPDKELQQIYYGAPGTGKSYIVNRDTKGESVVRTTFHPDSDYSTFVGCYKPTTKEVEMRDVTGKVIIEYGQPVTENRIIYQFVDQVFLQAYIKAWKFYTEAEEGANPKKQFLIIEEINRGNCAQIFGDLFQLLDRNDYGFSDYYIHADRDMQKHLAKAFNGIAMNDSHKNSINAMYHNGERDIVAQVLTGEILLLPNNLYIWATMNTSDQSLFPIDSAFKRRWDWKYRPIVKGRDKDGSELNWRIKADTKEYDWWSFLEKINAIVGTTTNSEDKKLGFFFCKPTDSVISAETFVGKVIFYLWNDVFKNFGFDDPIFKDEDGSTLEFDKFYTTDIYGDTIVRTDKVERFLENLKVKVAGEIITEVEDEDGNTSTSSTRDYTKYCINGVGKYGKNILAAECVKEYIKLNPEMSVEDVLANWKSLGYIVTHFVESKEEHDARTDNSIRSVEIPCGDTFVYVEKNGYGNNGAVDKLIAAVNQKDWNIKIDKVE